MTDKQLMPLNGMKPTSIERRKRLADVAEIFTKPYPHLVNKANMDGYIETMVVHLNKYPDDVLRAIASLDNGVVTKCKYPPTIADVAEFVDDRFPPDEIICGQRIREV